MHLRVQIQHYHKNTIIRIYLSRSIIKKLLPLQNIEDSQAYIGTHNMTLIKICSATMASINLLMVDDLSTVTPIIRETWCQIRVLIQARNIVLDQKSLMKVLVFIFALFIALVQCYNVQATCTHDLEVLCIDDINKAYPICQQAAQEKGKDVPVDLECMKYLGSIDKDCWPCICAVAEAQHWKITGCK